MPTDMTAYGLTEPFRALAAERPELTPARVTAQEKGVYQVIHAGGEQSAAVSGKYRYGAQAPADYPAVGDFVLLSPGAGGGPAVIHALLPRKSVFIRKAAGTANSGQVVAANVDRVFLCMSLNQDFNLRRLERYLSIAWESGAAPVILLTKADLCGELAEKLAQVQAVAAGAEVLTCSGLAQEGCRAVLPYLHAGQTIALLGSSGVGKSTLINRLLGQERLKTGGLRNDDKGRHTTTHRELLPLPGGGLVIDTPGMRELGMWGAAEGVEKTFEEIEALAHACRFKNCTHGGEPGCAVRAALESGELTPERWSSYQKLQKESARAQAGQSRAAAKKQKFKSIALQNKTNRKK